jgi:hypothetical protein
LIDDNSSERKKILVLSTVKSPGLAFTMGQKKKVSCNLNSVIVAKLVMRTFIVCDPIVNFFDIFLPSKLIITEHDKLLYACA